MSEQMDKMKALIEQKKAKEKAKQNLKPDKKIGAGKAGMNNLKSGGSNNKV